jgi:DNA modification methylase
VAVRDQSFETVPIDALRPHPDNPRRADTSVVVDSIAANGFYGALVVQRSTGHILAGNHRWRAARESGITELPVLYLDVDDDRARRILLVDNRTSDLAGYDETELVALLLLSMSATEAQLSGTGFTEDDLAALVAADLLAGAEAAEELDDCPDAPEAPTSAPGDLWLLGRHRLLVGDARDPLAYARLLDGAQADMVWTDPPYGVAIVGGCHELTPEKRLARGGKTIENDALDGAALQGLLRESLGAALAACRPGASWYVAAPAGPLHLVFATVLADLGAWRQTLTWVKDSFVLGRSDYHYRHESIFYGWKEGAAHTWHGGRAQDNVLEVPRPKRSTEHPTMKPVELVRRCIVNSSDPEAIILDPFAGSGTTLLAAHITGRTARVIELDPRYADVICRRYQDVTGESAVHEATGETFDVTAKKTEGTDDGTTRTR